MPKPLKHIYSQSFFDSFSGILEQTIPGFDRMLFFEKIYTDHWEKKELKERMKHIAATLHHFMPDDFSDAMPLVLKLIPEIRKSPLADLRLEFMFLPEYVERYGTGHFEISINAMEEITPFTSCEFAVRPFIIRQPQKMMRQMELWSRHKNRHVRRLASEGCRPRLPWAMALPQFKKDPKPVLPVLENLKNDPSEYVRRSVANNLNDIAKDHPELVLRICRRWKGGSSHTDRIVKHACRTLLKNANPEALELFGFLPPEAVSVHGLHVQNNVRKGESLAFGFSLTNNGHTTVKLRVEYGIDYRKANGSARRKIFKITENSYSPGETVSFSRNQSFRELTTRKHYPGKHRVAVIVNGREMASGEFDLIQ